MFKPKAYVHKELIGVPRVLATHAEETPLVGLYGEPFRGV